MQFTSGDKVSLLNDDLEGVVVREHTKGEYLVLISDGFEIPVPASELILKERPGSSAKAATDAPTSKGASLEVTKLPGASEEALHIAATLYDEYHVDIYLVNPTNGAVVYSIINRSAPVAENFAYGELSPRSAHLLKRVRVGDLASFKKLHAYLLLTDKKGADEPLIHIEANLRSKTLLTANDVLPLLNKKGKIYLQRQQTEEMIQEKQELATRPTPVVTLADHIDLHIEELIDSFKGVKAEDYLSIQLEAFRDYLNRVKAISLKQFVVIHGVGKGILRQQVLAILQEDPDVLKHTPADYRKFGYGATKVLLK